jgi:hypothetical protein
MSKIDALAKFLKLENYVIEEADSVLEVGGEEYLVLTDTEADERAAEYIKESLWAFNPSFLIYSIDSVNRLSVDDAIHFENMLRELQCKLCESANAIILGLVGKNLDRLINDAIVAEGRGHFLSPYDGEEHEEGEYLIYRLN